MHEPDLSAEGRTAKGASGESGPTLTFLGGAGTVTGSKYLLEGGGQRVLVDCGLFQGGKELRLRNWAPFPVPPGSIDSVLLTHAHLDHSGYLPALIKNGFSGRVLCSSATIDYAEILLPDSGYLQEKDADFANRHGFSKHKPALPLYTSLDAKRALENFSSVDFETDRDLAGGVRFRLHRAGHIMGAAIVAFDWEGDRIVFSGDLGRYDDPMMRDPTPVREADVLMVESTYGNRRHDRSDPQEALAVIVERTVRRGGTVVIPAFAVGRAQLLLFHLDQLKRRGRLTGVPVYLDSPMAIDATEMLCRHLDEHKLPVDQCKTACSVATYVREVEKSKALTADPTPKVIISASGMATGGRVLHHLKRYAPDPNSTVLFAGFQAAGTRGAAMVAGARSVRIHGEEISIRAEVENLSTLSAHADADEVLRWLGGFARAPRMTFVTHGEPAASAALKARIEQELGWPCRIPKHMERVELR